MSSDTKAIIGAIVATWVVLGDLPINQNAAGLKTRVDDLRSDRTERIDLRSDEGTIQCNHFRSRQVLPPP